MRCSVCPAITIWIGPKRLLRGLEPTTGVSTRLQGNLLDQRAGVSTRLLGNLLDQQAGVSTRLLSNLLDQQAQYHLLDQQAESRVAT